MTIFAGTQPAALYRSDDLGETWRELSSLREVPGTEKWTFPPPPHIAHVKSTIFHPDEPRTIFALVEQGALLKSVDDGQTWLEMESYSAADDEAYRDTHRLIIAKGDSDRFFLATGEGLYRSGDGGANWDHLTRRGELMGYPDFLFFDPRDENVIFLGGARFNPGRWRTEKLSDSRIMRSADGGQSWVDLDHGLPKPVIGAFEAMTLHQWDGGMTLLIATATGEIYSSDNDGDTWTCIVDDLAPVSKDHHHIAFLPADEAERALAARRALHSVA